MRTPSLRLAALVLLCAAWPLAASALTVEVSGTGHNAQIGRDLVLELLIRADNELDAASLTITADAQDGFLGTAYAPRALGSARGRELRLEWAAPVPPDAAAGERTLALTVSAPGPEGARTARWQGTVTVDYGKEWSADRISAFIARRGLLPFLAVVFGFGVLMSLSPCIYPMIPITLAVIGARSQDKGAVHGLLMSATYVLGMALVYAVLGALSATVFSGITAFMQSPAVVVPIALLLVALAFSMFGAYELQAPAFLRDRFQGSGSPRSGVAGVFVMGMVAGLVASPCVGPFLAALLVWVATTGNWFLGFISLFTFGIGMGLLLMGVGTFPALVGSMPRSGGWMDTVKKAMGLLLLAMAFWFVRPGIVLAPKVFALLVGATTVVVAVFVGAFDAVTAETGWWDRTRKGLGVLLLVTGLLMFTGGLLTATRTSLLPTPAEPHAAAAAAAAPATAAADAPSAGRPDKVAWEKVHTGDNVQAFLDARLAEAKAAGRPVMIDFWAEWCVYCKKLDKSVWNQPGIVAEAQRFMTIKIDATATDDDEMAAIKARWEVAGLPRIVFIDSRGEYLPGRSSGFVAAPEMLALMQGIR